MRLSVILLFILTLFNIEISAEEQRKLILGVSPDYPPFEFIHNAEIQGFDIELAKKITNELGYELEIKTLDFNGLIPALKTGRVDFVMSSMNPTEKRLQQVDFSNIYHQSKFVLIFPAAQCPDKENGEMIEYDFHNKRIGTQLGTLMHNKLEEIKRNDTNIDILAIVNANFLFQELKQRRVDAILLDELVAKRALTKLTEFKYFYINEKNFKGEGIAIAFKKGSSLTPEFNRVLNSLQENGYLNRLIDKWLIEEAEE